MSTLDLTIFTDEEIDNAVIDTVKMFSQIEQIDMNRLKRQIQLTSEILKSFAKGKNIAIIDAPTGFGKSILAFFIHFTMDKLCKTKSTTYEDSKYSSYLLTSNKFLQEQYLRDIDLFKFDAIKMLKGQSNYICNVDNVSPFTKAACHDESIKNLTTDGVKGKFPCFSTCTYLNARKNAISADSTILNYAYFLTTMNFVHAIIGPTAPFKVRDLTIFDECHVIGQIVSDMFSLKFNPAKFIREVKSASAVIATQKSDKTYFEKYEKFDTWSEINKIMNLLSISEVNIKENLFALKQELLTIVNDFAPYVSAVMAKKESGEDLSTFDKYMIDFGQTIIAPYSSITKQIDVYDKIGFDSAVISTTQLDKLKNKYLSDEDNRFLKVVDAEFTFECTNESEMVQNYALKFTNYSIFMSATIGKPESFAKRFNFENGSYECFEVDSDFDYRPSPIAKVHPMISMSFKDKANNMDSMIKRIIHVVNENPNVRGLIHTGNFEIMKKLEVMNHPRILTYSNSTQKEAIIKILESRPDAVLAGPSLIEGVDLKDDLCRFMIYAKVPYLSLASKLNKRKMELYDDWYNFQTLVSFQQGLGRAIRNKTDWCKTYLLDKSFESFFGRYKIPNIISTRLIDVESTNIHEEMPNADDEFELLMKKLEK